MAHDYLEIVTQAFAVARGSNVKNIFNIWHYRRVSGSVTPNKSNIFTFFEPSVCTPLLAAVNVDYTQVQTTVRFFDDAMDAPVGFAQSGVGAITGDRMETFVSAVINYKSNTKGKFARGSKHIAPMSESDSSGDVWGSATITRLAAIASGFLAGFTDSDGNVWKPIVKSSKFGAQYKVNPTTVVAYDVVGTAVNKTAGTMKRRKVKTVQ